MGAKGKSLLASPLAMALLYRVLRSYYCTLRVNVKNEEQWLNHLKHGGKVLLCLWHQQLFAGIRQSMSYSSYHPSVMISKSRDGDLIAGFMKTIGWIPVRGSSSRGGGRALREMITRLDESGLAVHILDGPQGPIGKVKIGAIQLAQAANAMLVPICVSANRAWYLKSWDRFMLPKPFSRITLRYYDMIMPVATEDPEELEKHRQKLEAIMTPYLHL